jgi:hypothetical protein
MRPGPGRSHASPAGQGPPQDQGGIISRGAAGCDRETRRKSHRLRQSDGLIGIAIQLVVQVAELLERDPCVEIALSGGKMLES